MSLSNFTLAVSAIGLALLSEAGTGAAAAAAKACDTAALAGVKLEVAKVRAASEIPQGSYTPEGTTKPLSDLPAFCRIQANASPIPDSRIQFEVWVPQGSSWNGKLVTTGNGGYSPVLSYTDMAYALRQGYAVIGGDTGHQSADPNEMFWGVGHPERIADWGKRSIHVITVPGKQLVSELRAQDAKRAYYYGCSTGGHQGYSEMQNYPEDFDGVIAGAPGNNRTRLNVEFLHRFLSNRSVNTNGSVILTAPKATLIMQSAIAACDRLDDVTDGVIEDPRACTTDRFNVASLQCSGGDAANCLTAEQVEVAQKIYAGPKNPRTGAQLYPGLVVGTEAGWPQYWGTTEPVRADFWRLWAFENPQWNWWTFDYDRDVLFAEAKLGHLVDQTNPDLNSFKTNGGKAIVYQGWQDPVVNAVDTIGYIDKVTALQGSRAETDTFLRLFLVPGMGHCNGGAGATNFGNQSSPSPVLDAEHDVLMALDRWVEQGIAPDRIVASRVVDGNTIRTRPICPFPKKAAYRGTGSTDDASNFVCE
jgi:feruloyl esterase